MAHGAVPAILLAVALIAACSEPINGAASASPTPASPESALAPELLDAPLVTCGDEHAFDADLLSAAGAAEGDDDAAAEALRRFLLGPEVVNDPAYPPQGWVRVVDEPAAAQFVARVAGGWTVVDFDRSVTGWVLDLHGSCARVVVLPPGIHAASWRLDPAAAVPSAEATSIGVLVREEACASGRPPGDRLLAPLVLAGADRIDIVFGVRDLTTTGVVLCPANPEVPVVVDLGEPIGVRGLYDGRVVPSAFVAPAPVPGAAVLAERYRCDTVPFLPPALLQPGTAELGGEDAALALRDFLSGPLNDGFMPLSGWRRLGTTGDLTEFATFVDDPAFNGYVYAAFERVGARWQISRWGSCEPRRAAAAGEQSLAWWLPGGAPDLGSRLLSINIIADGCNSGPALEDIQPPLVELVAGAATIILTGTAPDPPGCPPLVDPTELSIDLPEPIGTRALLDGSTFPPRNALTEPRWFGGTGG